MTQLLMNERIRNERIVGSLARADHVQLACARSRRSRPSMNWPIVATARVDSTASRWAGGNTTEAPTFCWDHCRHPPGRSRPMAQRHRTAATIKDLGPLLVGSAQPAASTRR